MTVTNGAVPGEPRRLPVVVAVLAALVLAGAASVLIRPATGHPASGSLAAETDGLPGAHSTAWFCAGPLPVGVPHEASSIAIANRGPRPATAEVTIVLASGAGSTEKVAVPADHESVVGLSHVHGTSVAAVRVVVDGNGFSVVELVQGALGPDAAPCARQAASTQYLAVGSTAARNNLAISLYNPGSTPAVANVSFATPLGPESPPAFQGVLVAAGHVVVLFAAHSLPFRRFVSATVRSSGGGIVVGASDTVENRGVALSALQGSATRPSTRWFFAPTSGGASASQAFDLMDPGKRPADVEIRLGGPNGIGEITLALAPGATTRYVPAGDESVTAVRWAVVTSLNDAPIVAAREVLVGSALKTTAPRAKNAAQRRRRSLFLLPALPVGFTITSGVTAPADDWVLIGGQSDPRVSEFVTVANFTAHPATVWIRPLKGTLAGLGPLRLPADGSVLVDLADLPAAAGRLALRVTADVAVVAGEELYARGSSGSVGLAAPAAFPVG
ncbi:MAG TPA: DUF5719 family protein [Acidimicrobiales bacterium]|nr:DUF5719 family protein [Acidimicrobiales bacterium]